MHGILALMPMDAQIDQNTVFNAIAPEKDLDCVNPANIGHVLLGDQLFAPATPSACIEILDREGIELQGLDVTIVNHSNIVGKPVALLCLNRNASVHVVHVFSKDVPAACREADVLICAAPVQNLIKADMVKPGAVVIDVTTIRVDGKQVGSLEFEAVCEVAGRVTPVPGGVGPVTNVILLKNALVACKAQTGVELTQSAGGRRARRPRAAVPAARQVWFTSRHEGRRAAGPALSRGRPTNAEARSGVDAMPRREATPSGRRRPPQPRARRRPLPGPGASSRRSTRTAT